MKLDPLSSSALALLAAALPVLAPAASARHARHDARLVPAAGAHDARIVGRLYDPGVIVTVRGHTGIQTTIEFRADERIDNIAVGDSTEWQVTPNKRASLVFVKPMKASSHTNMTVITDRRTYLFDLVARPGLAPAYILRFSYAPDPVPPPPPTLLPVEAEIARAGSPPPESSPADLHFNWVMSGMRSLWPARLFDDGQSVWLSWPRDAEPPAILRHDPAGGDGPLNYRIAGDYIVVDGVPAQITLKRGKQTATLMAPARLVPGSDAPAGKTPRHHKPQGTVAAPPPAAEAGKDSAAPAAASTGPHP
ncbi:MAG TPA: TrbG/VirB9 family P-type conjugative transfer protein [Novosphingobium sp.]|nr:TrbG/VirB9 family P-type conjugative transfer protein [Novosphingobium sp.]